VTNTLAYLSHCTGTNVLAYLYSDKHSSLFVRIVGTGTNTLAYLSGVLYRDKHSSLFVRVFVQTQTLAYSS
jgi:hypothetical protein